LSDDVIFLGVKENIYDYYQAMDIFVLPSRYEGLPVVGVEAQTSGLPCVFSDAMTEDVKQLDSTVFLNLSDSVVKWSDRIIAFKGYDRVDKSKKLKENGFDIRSESMKLQKFYLDKICK
jgi:glycosyltransferase EpsF